MATSRPTEVKNFLTVFKFYAQSSINFQFLEERDVHMNNVGELGIKPYQVRETILQLTPSNYVSGPDADKKYLKHNVWIFGVSLDGVEVYIKLSDNFTHGIAKRISFHKSKFPMTYVYPDGGDLS